MPNQPIQYLIKTSVNKPHRSNEFIDKRKKNEEKLQAPSNSVKPPTWLSEEAKKLFKKSVDELKKIKIINNLDVNTLAVYCDSVIKYSEFENEIERLNELYEKAEKIEDIEVQVKTQMNINKMIINYTSKKLSIADNIRKYAIEFGLTPQSRARLAIPHAKKKEKTEEEELFDNV
jgi:P27 family predicted phage terminase small subunit